MNPGSLTQSLSSYSQVFLPVDRWRVCGYSRSLAPSEVLVVELRVCAVPWVGDSAAGRAACGLWAGEAHQPYLSLLLVNLPNFLKAHLSCL